MNAYRVIRDEDGVPAKLLVSPQKLVLMTNPQPCTVVIPLALWFFILPEVCGEHV
jgi:hypothetical protein